MSTKPRKPRTSKQDRVEKAADAVMRPIKLLSASQIMLHLHNEHKYMSKLLDMFSEQLELLNVERTPDLNILYEIAQYMHEFSDESHHPHEDIIYRKLADRDASMRSEVDNMLIEHEAMSKKTEALLSSIKIALRDPSLESAKSLRFRCEDYISTLTTHMDLEESHFFPRIREVLTDDDWAAIITDIQPDLDPLFGRHVENRYQGLYRLLSLEVERATEDFRLAEFIGLGFFIENIGIIATHSNSIAGIFSRRFRQASRSTTVAYRKLWRAQSRSTSDYLSVTIDCMLNNFDTYTEAMRDIGRVLRKARAQIAEPYSSRLRIYHDTVRSNDDAASTSQIEH